MRLEVTKEQATALKKSQGANCIETEITYFYVGPGGTPGPKKKQPKRYVTNKNTKMVLANPSSKDKPRGNTQAGQAFVRVITYFNNTKDIEYIRRGLLVRTLAKDMNIEQPKASSLIATLTSEGYLKPLQ